MGVPKVYLPIIEKMQIKTVNQWTGRLWSSTTYLNELKKSKTQIYLVESYLGTNWWVSQWGFVAILLSLSETAVPLC